MPASLQSSATGLPAALPASICLRISMICSGLRLAFFMGVPLRITLTLRGPGRGGQTTTTRTTVRHERTNQLGCSHRLELQPKETSKFNTGCSRLVSHGWLVAVGYLIAGLAERKWD